MSGGEFLRPIAPYRYPEPMRHTVRAEKVSESDFRIPATPGQERVRVIRVIDATITREAEATLTIKNGYLEKNLSKDILPVAVINRNDRKQIGRGFITGTGIKKGAFATTVTWDTGNILVAGSSETGMAAAVNRLIDLQGGYVICSEDRMIFEFPMPIFGYIPECNMEEIREKTKELDVKMAEIGSIIPRPFLALQTIPFTGLPFLRITDKGLADIKNKKLVPVYL